MFTTIFVRHGESSWNRRGLMQGQTNSPGLTTAGRAQAEQVAAGLAGTGIEIVLTSDLRRARQTAKIISTSLGVPVQVEPRLRERHLGTAQGRPGSADDALDVLGISDGLVRDPHCVPAGGETLSEFHRRVSTLLAELCQRYPHSTAALVTHGGVVRMARRCAEVGSLGLGSNDLVGMPWPEVENGSAWSFSWTAPEEPAGRGPERPTGGPESYLVGEAKRFGSPPAPVA